MNISDLSSNGVRYIGDYTNAVFPRIVDDFSIPTVGRSLKKDEQLFELVAEKNQYQALLPKFIKKNYGFMRKFYTLKEKMVKH